jgi:hypothetical protein
MSMPKINLNPTPVEVDQFARAASAARRRMFDAARNNSGSPPFDSLADAVETLSSRLEALRNSVCVVPREAVTGTRSRPDPDQDQNKDKPSRLGNDRPNIRPIRASEKRPSRSPGTERGSETEEYVTSAAENRRAGRSRSGNEPIGYSKEPYQEEQPNEE